MDHFKVTRHYTRVRQLNAKINPEHVPSKVTMPSPEVRELRARLILEEAMETIDALGVDVYVREDDRPTPFDELQLSVRRNFPYDKGPNLVEIADGCADLSVVTIGTLVACGIPDKFLLELVDKNNLAKFGPGGYLRDDGKWIKPPDHQPPDIKSFLEAEGWEKES